MKNIFVSVTVMMFVIVSVCLVNNAYATPPARADEQEVLAFLKKQKDCQFQDTEFNVKSENIGPNKRGLMGSCTMGNASTGSYFFLKKHHVVWSSVLI